MLARESRSIRKDAHPIKNFAKRFFHTETCMSFVRTYRITYGFVVNVRVVGWELGWDECAAPISVKI